MFLLSSHYQVSVGLVANIVNDVAIAQHHGDCMVKAAMARVEKHQ